MEVCKILLTVMSLILIYAKTIIVEARSSNSELRLCANNDPYCPRRTLHSTLTDTFLTSSSYKSDV